MAKKRDYAREHRMRKAREARRQAQEDWGPFKMPDDYEGPDDEPPPKPSGSTGQSKKKGKPEYTIGDYRRARNKTARRRVKNQEANTRIARERLAANREFRDVISRDRRIGIAQRDASQRAAREERAARNQANIEERQRAQAVREARAEQNRQDRLDAQARRANAGPTTAPQFSTGTGSLIEGGPNKQSVAVFIVIATGLAALGSVIRTSANPPQTYIMTTPNGVSVKVPQHLRGLGGAFVAGAVALIVNEIYPGAGLVLGVGILGLAVIPTWTPILGHIGDNVFKGGSPLPSQAHLGPAAPKAPANRQSPAGPIGPIGP